MRAVYGGFLSQMTRQAKREMVLWADWPSMAELAPGVVSVTTKSIMLSVDRPIWTGGGR